MTLLLTIENALIKNHFLFNRKSEQMIFDKFGIS